MNTAASLGNAGGASGAAPTPGKEDASFSALVRSHFMWQGVLFSIITALSAELFLEQFSPQPSSFAHPFLAGGGRVGVLALSIYVLHHFLLAMVRAYRPRFKDMATLCGVMIGTLMLVALGRLVAESLAKYFQDSHLVPAVSAEAFYFAIPFGIGTLVLQAVLGSSFGLMSALTLMLTLGLYLPHAALFVPYALVTALTACLSLSHFRSRSANLRAGMYIALISLPFALAAAFSQHGLMFATTLIMVFAALTGGILCAFFAAGVAPIVEHLGGYATDIRLIEMATLDHPLLKDLSVQAAGTWNHSMVMGMMVEAAADAIGANPVLARVGAYFHDIGKIRKPLYFVENQAGEENRHDKLSTSMSALIIRTHVKDGIELARKHGLPKALEDMIPQHHGTSRIEYFYDKALKEAEEADLDPASVDESLYRYPGPRPQTREAGILMLADGIEAAARTLSEPGYDRIQGMVQKMINKVFASGELNECDLTLRDLHQIAKAFTRVLTGIYHQRIAYAEPVEKIKAEETEQLLPSPAADSDLESGNAVRKQKTSSEEKPAKEANQEDLKRLGL